MSATCLNCKAKLSCGCNKRSASNGASVCTLCQAAYEATLKRTIPKPNAPSNVTVFYNGPSKT